MTKSMETCIKPVPQSLACGPEAQAARRDEVYAKLRDLTRSRLVEENGRCLVPYLDNDGNRFAHADYRMPLWLALAFLAGDESDVGIGNRLIEGVELKHSCHFSAVTSAVLLTSQKALLTPAVVAKLEKFLASCFGEFMTLDFRFQGANDNAPFGCCTVLSLGGSYFGNPSLVAFAKQRLQELAEYLELHGYLHECVSPTYTGISLADVAELAEHSPDAETRALALRLEQRVWQEALLHYHPGIGYWAGPYSRAYCADRDGHVTLLTLTFHAALGFSGYLDPVAELFPNHQGESFAKGCPPNLLPKTSQRGELRTHSTPCRNVQAEVSSAYGVRQPEEGLERGLGKNLSSKGFPQHSGLGVSAKLRYHNSWDFLRRSFAGQAAPVYHPPVELVEQALAKAYPLEISGSNSWMNTGYAPSSVSTITCHMEASHTVASFGSNLMAGQCVPFQILLKRVAKPSKLGDIRSIYSRMWLSDAYDSLGDKSLPVKEADYDKGSAFSVQDGNTVMLGYVPCAEKPRELATIRTTLYFPLFGSMPDEVWCGTELVSGFSATYSAPAWVFIRERDTYLAFRPMLAQTAHCALGLIKLGVRDEMAMLSFYNMCDFHAHPLEVESQRAFGGGFVCEVGTQATHGGFAAFRASFADAVVADEQWNGVRSMEYRHGQTRLQLQYDYKFLNLVRAVVNGKLRREDIKLSTTPALLLILP